MPIAVLSGHPDLTLAQFDEVDRRIHEATGGGEPKGLIHHSVSGSGAGLTVLEIWESEEDLAALGQLLAPVITEMGLDAGKPVVMPLLRLVQEGRSGPQPPALA